MRSRFDEQLELLNKQMIQMGELCEEAIQLAATSLTEANPKLAAAVEPIDKEIDQMERDIETLCLKMLLQQQPVARDLRQISAALKMITDMERIGDQAADIADIITESNGRAFIRHSQIRGMADATIQMVTDSVTAYVNRDMELAKQVVRSDDTVDIYFDTIKTDLIDRIAKKPEDGVRALDLLMISKYFERIGDHATNIAQWVMYSITGTHKNG